MKQKRLALPSSISKTLTQYNVTKTSISWLEFQWGESQLLNSHYCTLITVKLKCNIKCTKCKNDVHKFTDWNWWLLNSNWQASGNLKNRSIQRFKIRDSPIGSPLFCGQKIIPSPAYILKQHAYLIIKHGLRLNAYRMLGQAKSTALFYASLFILFQLVKVQFCSTSNQYCQFLLPLPFFSIQSSCVALMPKCFYYSTKLLFTLFKHQQGPLQ